jgi:hypothetical protein
MQFFSSQVRIVVRGPGLAVYLLLLAGFGVLVPWQKGLDFLDPVILIAYSCLGGVFAGPAAVQMFAEVPRSVRAAVERVAIATVWGEVIVLILLLTGMVTVRLTHPGVFPLDVQTLVGGVALGAALSLALSAMAAWLRLAQSPGIARSALRGVYLALLIAFLLRSRWLPDVVWSAAGLSLALAVVLLVLLGMAVVRNGRTSHAQAAVEEAPREGRG